MLRNDISMLLSLPSNITTFNDYEKSLKHKYAQRFRNIRKSIEGLAIKELSVEETENNKHLLFELYKEVSDKQTFRLGLLNVDFIPKLKKSNPLYFKLYGVWKDAELIAFTSAWVKEKSYDMFYIGMKYAYNTQYNLYFNLLFLGLEQALNQGKTQIIYGRTALDAKARVGATAQYLATFLYIKNKGIRKLMTQFIAASMNNENNWENKHPFKIVID